MSNLFKWIGVMKGGRAAIAALLLPLLACTGCNFLREFQQPTTATV